MKKIIINGYYIPGFTVGFNRYVHNMIRMIIKFDAINEYYIFYPDKKIMIPEDIQKIISNTPKNIHFIIVQNFKDEKKFSSYLISYCEGHIFDFDFCIHPFPVLLSNKLKFIKHIIIIHDLIPFEILEWKQLKKNFLLFKGFSLKAYIYLKKIMKFIKNAYKVFTVSEYSKNSIIRYQPELAEKISILPNIIQTKGINSAEERIFLDKNNLLGKQYFFYFGGTSERKNFWIVLKAFNKIDENNCPYFVISCDRKDRKKIVSFLDSKHKKKIIFFDKLDDDFIAILLKNAFGFLFMSLFEGFGLPPVEAQSYGIPVICNNNSSLPEVCADAALYAENNIESLVTTIKKISNEELRKILHDKAINNVIKYSIEEIYRKYRRIIE